MADVVVNIRGNADQLKRELEDVARTTSGSHGGSSATPGRAPDQSRPTILPPSDRLLDDVRAQIQSQRVSTADALEAVKKEQQKNLTDNISSKYSGRRADLESRMSTAYENIDRDIDRQKAERYQGMGAAANDPLHRANIESQFEDLRDRQYRATGQQFDDEEAQLNSQESSEIAQAETELAKVIKELTEQLQRDGEGGNSDSYMNQLRNQRRQLVEQRDNAPDEESAIEAQRRIAELDGQLNRVTGNDGRPGRPRSGFSAAAGIAGAVGLVSSLQSGDIGGGLMGAGGMAMMINPIVGSVILALGGITKILSATSSTSEGLSDLARYGTAGGYYGSEGRHYLGSNMPEASYKGMGYTDYGMSVGDFADVASKKIRARGMTDDWYSETMSSIGLERQLGLNQNSLTDGSKYDRYGQNVTESISRLVSVLSGIDGSGVSIGDFSRVQEKFDIQQQIMGGYMGKTDKPDYNVANKMLAGFSSVSGITQDSRMGGDIQQFQNMIQSPINDRMKALVNSTVADLFPETGGRMDKIDRALQNPENEGKIMQSVVQRITQQFGGTDTQMGYFAFKALLPNIAPDRRDAYTQAFNEQGGAGGLIAGGDMASSDIVSKSEANRTIWEQQALGYFTDYSKGIKSLVDGMNTIVGKVTGTTVAPKGNTTKPGKKPE